SVVHPAFELVETRKRIVHSLVGHQAAKFDAVLCAFEPRRDLRLAAAGFAQAVLQLLNVLFVRAQGIIEHGDFLLQLIGHVRRALAFDQRSAGKVFPVLRKGKLRLFRPVSLKLVELYGVAVHFLLVGDGASRAGAYCDQRFFHLEDDHADHLRRIVGMVEQFVEIGGDDVAGTGKNAHPGNSGNERVDRIFQRLAGGGRRTCPQALYLTVEPRSASLPSALARADRVQRVVVRLGHASSTICAETSIVSGDPPNWWVRAITLRVTIAVMLTSAAKPNLLVKNSRSYMVASFLILC